jgi:opacity protein-like surface antigen
MRGWEVSGTFRILPWLSAKADFSGHYGRAFIGISANYHAYLFGAEARQPARVSPFAHVLIGAAHVSTSEMDNINAGIENTLLSSDATSFAWLLGGGIDVKVASFASLRLAQIDYLGTAFSPTYSLHRNIQNQPRFSAGFVVRF